MGTATAISIAPPPASFETAHHSAPPPVVVPLPTFERDTLNKIFFGGVDRFGDRDAIRYKESGIWKALSYREAEAQVIRLAGMLNAHGINPGDRIGILSESRPGWPTTDYAALGLGAVVVPVYPTLPADQIAFILNDSAVRIVFVSTREQYEKIKSIRREVPSLEKVVSFDDIGEGDDPLSLPRVLKGGGPADPTWTTRFRQRALAVEPGSLATIIYTSGTTGTPKGVMLTHYNLAAMIAASGVHGTLAVKQGDVALSLLPLSHIFERACDYYLWDCGVTIAYAESIANVPANLLEVHPDVMVSVPRLFEKIYGKVMGAPGLKGRIARWASKVGGRVVETRAANRAPSLLDRVQYALANLLVFRKLRHLVGGRLRVMISGGAPLSAEVAKFFFSAGLPIYEGYGLTETSPVLAANRPGDVRLGTVGKPYPGVELRIADTGEILARGPSVMQGYWRNPEATAAAIDAEGWFHTGDVGEFDEDSYLRITDRIKDLIVTAGGKKIAPQPIEGRTTLSPFVAQAILIGDRRPFPTMLVVPDLERLVAWATERGLFNGDMQALVNQPLVRELLEDQTIGQLQDLAQYERPKKIGIIMEILTIDSGLLTPTLKVRRRQVEKRFREVIESLYSTGSEQVR
jgi:long-chain acyl-CoA synthetase